jgi:hypothetical protein
MQSPAITWRISAGEVDTIVSGTLPEGSDDDMVEAVVETENVSGWNEILLLIVRKLVKDE